MRCFIDANHNIFFFIYQIFKISMFCTKFYEKKVQHFYDFDLTRGQLHFSYNTYVNHGINITTRTSCFFSPLVDSPSNFFSYSLARTVTPNDSMCYRVHWLRFLSKFEK